MKKNLMNKKQGFFALFVTIMSFVFVVSVIIIPTIKADAPSITIPENNGYYRVLTNITGTTTGTCVNVSIYNVTGTYFNGSAWTATFINLSCNVTGTDWYYGNLSAFPTWTNGTTYEITANSSDGATNATASFIYDTWAPIATITSPSTSSWQNGSLANITGTATDGDGSSGVWMVNITLFNASLGTYWTGSAWGSTATNLTATGTTSWYKNSGWPTWTNGTTYVVNASAVDNASNNGSTTSSVTFYMDTGGLVSQVTPISGYWKTTTPLTITATANDSIGGSGLKNVTLYYYNSSTDNSTWLGPWNFGTNSSPWFGVSWSFNFSNGTGYYQFFSIAIDNASNTETAPITNDSMCGYDFTAPATSVDVISPYCNNAAITITGAVSDNNISGISSVLLYCLNSTDNSTWSSAWLVGTDSDPWVAISWSFDFAAKNGTGYYRFFTIGVDNATNVESAPGSGYDVNCSYEFVAPTSSVDTITTYWKTSSPLAITGTAEAHNMSGLKNVTLYYYNSSTDNSTWSGPWNFGTNSSPWFGVSWSFTFPNGTGYYRFNSRATDNASNVEAAPEGNDTICGYDFTAPATSVDVISPYWNNAAITITGAVSNNNISGISSVLLYYLNSTNNETWSSAWLVGTDSDPWVAISWSFDFAAKNGTGYYRFFTIGVDNATNVESAPGSGYDVNCSYEFLAPTSIVDTITTYWKTSSPLAITGTAAPHNMSGLKNVTLYYRYASSNNSYGGWVNHSVDVDPWTAISWSFGFSNGTGWYEFYSIANDNASNAESAPENNDTICGYDIPIVTITVPANNSFYNVLTTISGTTSMVSDLSFGGINRTNLTIYNSTGAGTYWNGTAWASGVTWLNATGYTSWTYNSTNVTWVNNTYYYVNATAVDNDSNDGVTVTSNFTFDTYAPEITAVNAGSITTSSATITWTTEQAANSTVEYGLTNSYGTSTADATFSTSHSVALPSNLSSGTRYHYRTVSYDQAGNRANSSDQTFTTSSGESTPSSNTAPTAEAGGPYSGFVNQTITFNGSRSTDDVGVTRYRWDWTNDGTYDTDWIASATITHMYTAVGNYTVKLQVRDIANLTGTDTATVAVTAPTVQHQAPVADMNGPYNALTYQAIQFDGSNSHGTDGIIVNYTWNFGDGIYGYDLSPLHSYDSAGTFSVTLTVKDINDLQDIATSTATILLDANRNNISDIMEQTIGVNITTSDIQPIEISNAMFDLVDTNGDGILDTFYNPTTNTKSTLGQQDGKQLIDVNDDGIWDYVYDPAAGTTTPYVVVTTPPVDNNWMPIIGIVVAIIIIIVLIVVVLIKKGRLYVEKKPKDEGEPKKPDESKKGK